jgi:hypothetical protein
LAKWPGNEQGIFRTYRGIRFSDGCIQNAVPTRSVSQIQTNRQLLTFDFFDLLCRSSANLLHCLSPLSLALQSASITWDAHAADSQLLDDTVARFRTLPRREQGVAFLQESLGATRCQSNLENTCGRGRSAHAKSRLGYDRTRQRECSCQAPPTLDSSLSRREFSRTYLHRPSGRSVPLQRFHSSLQEALLRT